MSIARIVISLEGGLIQDLTSDQPVEYVVLDWDAKNYGEEDERMTIRQWPNGKEGIIFKTEIAEMPVDTEMVDFIFSQFDETNNNDREGRKT